MMEILKNAVWIITAIILPVSGYFVGKYKSKNAEQDERIRKLEEKLEKQKTGICMQLQNSLNNQYFAFEQMGEITDYCLRNWKNMVRAYEGLDGDDYIHDLDKRIDNFKVIKTDILK